MSYLYRTDDLIYLGMPWKQGTKYALTASPLKHNPRKELFFRGLKRLFHSAVFWVIAWLIIHQTNLPAAGQKMVNPEEIISYLLLVASTFTAMILGLLGSIFIVLASIYHAFNITDEPPRVLLGNKLTEMSETFDMSKEDLDKIIEELVDKEQGFTYDTLDALHTLVKGEPRQLANVRTMLDTPLETYHKKENLMYGSNSYWAKL